MKILCGLLLWLSRLRILPPTEPLQVLVCPFTDYFMISRIQDSLIVLLAVNAIMQVELYRGKDPEMGDYPNSLFNHMLF